MFTMDNSLLTWNMTAKLAQSNPNNCIPMLSVVYILLFIWFSFTEAWTSSEDN